MSRSRRKGEFSSSLIHRVTLIERRVLQERSESGSAFQDQHLEQNNILINKIAENSLLERERRASEMKPIHPIPSLPHSDKDKRVRCIMATVSVILEFICFVPGCELHREAARYPA